MLNDAEKTSFAEKTALAAQQMGWPPDFVDYFRSNIEMHKISNQIKFYSFGCGQDNDDLLVEDFFKDLDNGRFLCIGSANGVDQTYSLLSKGWTGVYCDPDPLVFQGLFDATASFSEKTVLVNAAIVPEPGITEFHISSTQALSSVYRDLAGADSRKLVINPMTLDQLLDYVGEDFDYVQIDIEGVDDDVIKSIDWSKRLPRCKMIGIETGLLIWEYLWDAGNYVLTDLTEHNAYYRRLLTIDQDKKLKNG